MCSKSQPLDFVCFLSLYPVAKLLAQATALETRWAFPAVVQFSANSISPFTSPGEVSLVPPEGLSKHPGVLYHLLVGIVCESRCTNLGA